MMLLESVQEITKHFFFSLLSALNIRMLWTIVDTFFLKFEKDRLLNGDFQSCLTKMDHEIVW